jgi:predicted transcriptional regulator
MIGDEQALRETLIKRMRSHRLRLDTVARHLAVSPAAVEAFISGARLTSAALMALPKIVEDWNHEAQMASNRQTREKQVKDNTLTARNLKCTLVLDPAGIAALADPPTTRVPLRIRVADGDRVVTADIAAKALRKAKATIAQGGDVAVILQGKLMGGDVMTEAGLIAQPKAAKGTTELSTLSEVSN